jgi:DNA modification methylase
MTLAEPISLPPTKEPLCSLALGAGSMLLGDSRSLLSDIENESVDAVITDPPYGIGKADWDSEIPLWSIGHIVRVLKPGGAFLVFGLPPSVWMWSLESKQLAFRRELYWWHDTGYPANNWRLATETILYLTKGDAAYWGGDDIREPYAPRPERPNGRPDRQNPKGKSPGNILKFPRVAPNHKDWFDHPTVKPLALMRKLVLAVCPPGGIVLDPFAGSGTTCCAAVAEGRKYIGIERDPKHHATAVGRLSSNKSI